MKNDDLGQSHSVEKGDPLEFFEHPFCFKASKK